MEERGGFSSRSSTMQAIFFVLLGLWIRLTYQEIRKATKLDKGN